ncbi:MAG: tRNA guanosine(34) transglycosylase Tgt [Bacteroidales bacterium]|nr:tRNA guanosine(34) transglycosylase Tgt [Bacteroidales bacterium]
MKFTRTAADPGSMARCGVFTTDHGEVKTPIFMPVGTVGSVKGVYHKDLREDINAEIILGNTYHLYLRPGLDTLRKAGGLHKFESWDRPILTDSGGFQVFSLTQIRKITEEGCRFRSHIDGSSHMFTPENNVDTQRIIGSDIMMALDECCPGDADERYASKSLKLTQGWLERFFKRFKESEPLYGYDQAMFPIIQGCVYPDLRKRAVEHALELTRDCPGVGGFSIGGLAVGEPTEKMYEMLELVCPLLPEDKPRYLMGVGTPANILEGIARGVDMFDCVMPTRNGRNGMLFTWNGIINMRNSKWTDDFSPLDPDGTSFVDREYSKAYLHHLFIAKEMFAAMVASEHNLAFYLDLVRKARIHIEAGDFAAWKDEAVKKISTRL